MKRSVLSCGLLLATMLLNACYFSSVNPLPLRTQLDNELLGCWKSIPKEDGQKVEYMLFLEDKNGYLQIIMLESDYRYSEVYRGFISELSGEKYLNLQQIRASEDNKSVALDTNYYLVHYRIKNQKLTISLFDEKILKEAVKKRQLKGRLEGRSEELTLTDSTENLAAFIGSKKTEELLDTESLCRAERTYQLPQLQKK